MAGEPVLGCFVVVSTAGNRTLSEAPRSRISPSNRPHAWLFHVFSSDAPGRPLTPACSLDEIDEVALGRGAPAVATANAGGRRQLRLSFADQWMSTRHARIERVVGARVFDCVRHVASGEVQAKAEINKHREFQVWAEQGVSL